MTYDDWKLESPEDEDERINGPARRRAARQQYLEDHADEINDERCERREEEARYGGERDRDEWRHEAAEAQRLKR